MFLSYPSPLLLLLWYPLGEEIGNREMRRSIISLEEKHKLINRRVHKICSMEHYWSCWLYVEEFKLI